MVSYFDSWRSGHQEVAKYRFVNTLLGISSDTRSKKSNSYYLLSAKYYVPSI